MTIYIHFNISTGKSAVRLHNVESVLDAGVDSIKVRLAFADGVKTYNDVSHVALKPSNE